MKFRVGDVCEIIFSTCGNAGKECTIVRDLLLHPRSGELVYTIEVHGSPSGHKHGLWSALPSSLRLKRPPSWDSWITDTREVENEGPLVMVNASDDGGKTWREVV
jgi:Neuraminidase (sialidase)